MAINKEENFSCARMLHSWCFRMELKYSWKSLFCIYWFRNENDSMCRAVLIFIALYLCLKGLFNKPEFVKCSMFQQFTLMVRSCCLPSCNKMFKSLKIFQIGGLQSCLKNTVYISFSLKIMSKQYWTFEIL